MLSLGWDQPDLCRLLFEYHPEPMWIYDLRSLRFLAVNRAAAQQYGYSLEQFAEMTVGQLNAPTSASTTANVQQHKRSDGSLLYVEVTAQALTWQDKAAKLVVARDVTARVELETHARNFDVMFEQMADPVMLFDAHGRVERMNQAARAIFTRRAEFTPGTVSSRQLASRFSLRDEFGVPIPHDRLPVMRVLRGEVLAGASTFDGQVGPPSNPLNLNVTGAPIRDANGTIIGAVMVSRDVTERRRLERQAQEGLRELNERMEAFLSIAGHEMRTPLTSILGNLQLAERSLDELVDSSGPAELQSLKALLARVERQGRLLNRLVSDVLDASVVDGSRLELSLSRFDLLTVVDNALEEARAQMRGRSIELQVRALQSPVVEGDRARIGQVLNRFLSNANKFSPLDTPIRVGVTAEPPAVQVWVADQGPGVPPSERERIWQRFYRVDGLNHVSGSSIGLGLGLYLGRMVVERHGGTVGLDCPTGGGARFWFRLPLAPTPTNSGAHAETAWVMAT
jgi:PAS domain S-box-containing protein